MISGTSADAIDAALLRVSANGARLEHSISKPCPARLRQQIINASTIRQFMSVDAALGDIFAATALQLIAESGIAKSKIKAIGSHGQTLWHDPKGKTNNTLQAGDPNRIAWKTGIVTISDFRRMDMAAGGQGAPLVPAFHNWQFKLKQRRACVVNIGGIANISIPGRKLTGYDTGPGNCLMDSWIWQCKRKNMDKNGNWANTGTVQAKLLQSMMRDSYFRKQPPKSTGREYFNIQWIKKHTGRNNYRPQDIQATLAQLTANTIAKEVTKNAKHCNKVFICGGGWHNRTLIQKLQQQLQNHEIQSTSTAGIDPDNVEAAAFAWLAWRRLKNQPGTTTSVTGTTKATLLGAIYQPLSSKRRAF